MLIDPTTGYIDPAVFDRLRVEAQVARSHAIASVFAVVAAGIRRWRRGIAGPWRTDRTELGHRA